MFILIASIIGGLVALFVGGELLVRGAVSIAERLGLSHLVTGIVIVGAATSMPEMVASVEAALRDSPGIAWGNVVGSNLANSLLILGATALVAPIALHGVGKRDAVVALAATALLYALTIWQGASPWIGAALLALLVVYVVWRVKHPPENLDDDDSPPPLGLLLAIALFAGGVGILIVGGQLLVAGSIELAQLAGVSDAVIGLTIVAVGTSLPELAASLAAALKGRAEMAVGNVVGSNIYNILLIGGATMSIAPLPISAELIDIEMPVLLASAVFLLLLCRYFRNISRWMGVALLGAFAANTALVFA
ncbi:calcium/sodium antiporter [Aurantiacibacter sp. MUD61]|uniref:calcium/sodium antiporter n=1 Tax=Aurantiacibacter sp. MUD61 TaxID=3009083 RepID=UPI0022F0496C|nr:calcium/sodium antiporter [Aurantiacibacter sp. MUD61]